MATDTAYNQTKVITIVTLGFVSIQSECNGKATYIKRHTAIAKKNNQSFKSICISMAMFIFMKCGRKESM